MKTPSVTILISATLILTAFPGPAATVIISPAADAGLLQGNPDNNTGGHVNFAAGGMANGNRSRALLKFDPAEVIPAGSVINSVSLTLTVVSASSADSNFELRRMFVDWAEGDKTGQTGNPATPGEVTWNERAASGSPWAAPGGAAGTDHASSLSAVTFVGGLGGTTFDSTPALVADIQGWLDNSASNFGWILISQSESTPNTARRFASREAAAGSPRLTIEFSPVPEPGSLVLLLVGASAWLALRRRKA